MENENLSDNLSVEDSGEEILVLSVDMGDGRKDEIKVREKSNPDQLALEFCSRHRLGAKAKVLLTDEVEKNQQIALMRSRVSTRPTNTTNYSACSASPLRTGTTTGDTTEKSVKRYHILVENSESKDEYEKTSEEIPSFKDFKGNSHFSILKKNILNGSGSGFVKPCHKKSFSSIVNPIEQSKINLSLVTKMQSKEKSQKSKQLQDKNPSRPYDKYTPIMKNSQTYARPCKTPYQPVQKPSTSPPKSSPNPKVDKSERIMKKIKFKSYRDIFSDLNPDTKGFITKSTIYKSDLSTKVMSIITPLLEEIKEMDEKLSFDEFYDAMEMLMKVLTPEEKNAILMDSRAKPEVEVKEIKTEQIKKKQFSNSTWGLYERGLQKQKDLWRRLMHEKEEREKEEMKECIFKPNIAPIHKKSFSQVERPNLNVKKYFQ